MVHVQVRTRGAAAAAAAAPDPNASSGFSPPAAAAPDPPQRRTRGSGYYERYLRNRRRRGGEFLTDDPYDAASPPPPPTAWLPQLSDEPPAPGAPPALKHGNRAGGVVGPPMPWPGHKEVVAAVVRRAVAAYRLAPPPPVQRQQGRDRFRDRLADEEAAALLAKLRGARAAAAAKSDGSSTTSSSGGLLIELPDEPAAPPAAGTMYPLPPLPAAAEARARGLAVEVYVFWDVSSVHPKALDPRSVAAEFRRVLEGVGEVRGAYVYGTRKQLAWVPEAFMRRFAPERLAAYKVLRQQQQWLQRQQRQQQQEEGAAGAAGEAAAGEPGTLAPGAKLRCPQCGFSGRSYALVQRHMSQVHKRRAPPLEQLEQILPPTAALASSGAPRSRRQQPEQPQQQQSASASTAANAAELAAGWDGSLVNTGNRTLGRVAAYVNSAGAVFSPRGGAQVSLKYALAREGWEARLVQNEREAVDDSLAAGVADLLDALERRGGGDVSASHVVVAVASDSPAPDAALARARRLGCSAVAVCDQRGRAGANADALVRWRLVTSGRYQVVP
jgi:hypothetical protein